MYADVEKVGDRAKEIVMMEEHEKVCFSLSLQIIYIYHASLSNTKFRD